MIIEIKDLPEGRKVSRILVDVTFEDTEVPQSFLNETCIGTMDTEEPVSPAPAPVLQVPVPPPSANISSNVRTTNPSIPTEMLDMEF